MKSAANREEPLLVPAGAGNTSLLIVLAQVLDVVQPGAIRLGRIVPIDGLIDLPVEKVQIVQIRGELFLWRLWFRLHSLSPPFTSVG